MNCVNCDEQYTEIIAFGLCKKCWNKMEKKFKGKGVGKYR